MFLPIPFYKTKAFQFAIVVALIASAYVYGRFDGRAIEKAESAVAVNVANEQTADTKADIKTASQPVVTKYIDRVVRVEKKVPVYIDRISKELTPARNVQCVTPGIISTYNDSLTYTGDLK